MELLTRSAFLFAAFAAPHTLATAQIVTIGPFTGASQESFENLNSGQFACHPQRILGGTAELCATDTAQIYLAGPSQCTCALNPHQGGAHALSGIPALGAFGHARIRFTAPATRFGGYFALNCTVADGRADFFDPNGLPIGSVPFLLPNDCTYRWLGFEATNGQSIGSVELLSSYPDGRFLHMDELEADHVASIATYCVAKLNSLNCTPRIDVEGVPTAGAASGWIVRATSVFPGGVPGLLMYTTGGARASVPFQCGTLCVGPTAIRRSRPVLSTGFGGHCNGVYSIDMNAFASGALGGHPSAALSVPGTMVHAQWWGRDTGFAPPCASTLSNAVEYAIQ